MSGDKKWINLCYVLLAVLVSWILSQSFAMVARYSKFSNPLVLETIQVSTIFAFAIGFIGTFLFVRQEKVQTFSQEVLFEGKKITWPTRQMAYVSTIVVVVFVVISAFILGGFDWMCSGLVALVLKS